MTKKQNILKVCNSVVVGAITGIIIGIELSNWIVGLAAGFYVILFWLFMNYYSWSEKETLNILKDMNKNTTELFQTIQKLKDKI